MLQLSWNINMDFNIANGKILTEDICMKYFTDKKIHSNPENIQDSE